ncbi:uncharacterized oxidoreductase TM_0325-like [Dysidea avara]|uniref:uncharacterized oxidoreductase TM_0325-like n=1 Tax=Dysidea avara TaxID=196820 RepID=UPI00332D409C
MVKGYTTRVVTEAPSLIQNNEVPTQRARAPQIGLFSEEGARLVLFDLPSTEPKLKQLVTELLSLGSPAVIYVCGDVTNVEDVKKSVQRSVDELGEIDILFNNAGIFPIAPLQQTDEAMFKRVQDINVYGVFLMMKYASNQMIESGKGGVIINMSSYAGLMAFDAAFAYCTSKFAVSGMTRAAAKSLAKHNIRVCALGPYALEGSMTDQGIEAMAKAAAGTQDIETVKTSIYDVMKQGCPMARAGKMKEVAEVVLFLCSKEASYITGVVLPVDGGATA